MRVIAGTARGRRLSPVPGRGVRPTPDRVREALFNVVAPRVAGAQVLDLFAGTGALGIEALSRGARGAVFVDRSPAALAAVRRNLELTALVGRARVLAGDARRCLRRLAAEGARFDLAFLDPPYGADLLRPALEEMGRLALLVPGGIAVGEHPPAEEIPAGLTNLRRVRVLRYGEVALSLFQADGEEEGAL